MESKDLIKDEVAKVQGLVLDAINKPVDSVVVNPPNYIIEFLKINSSGKSKYDSLLNSVKSIDFYHPDTANLFNEKELNIISQYAFARGKIQGDELISIIDRAVEQHTNDTFSKTHQIINADMATRVLKDADERRHARSRKGIKAIDMFSFYRKGETSWIHQLSGFEMYTRFSTISNNYVEEASQRAQKYRNIGCRTLSDEILKSIESFKAQVSENYLGFHRLTMTTAAVILAKAHGYQLKEETDDRYEINNKIIVTRDLFKSHGFDSDSIVRQFLYYPMVYPAFVLDSIAPDNVKIIIDKLDKMPETGGRPIFDHYLLVVPGFNFASVQFRQKDGSVKRGSDLEQLKLDLYFELIKEKYIVPIILGEKDGKCYFVSYWS